jgi:hypothetical protein
MAEGRHENNMPSKVDLKGGKSITGLSADGSRTGAHVHHDKNRRRKSIASHMVHPIAGETMKERQVYIFSFSFQRKTHLIMA